jgi:DNA (cytosine-5)-methyltransferase 1
LDLFCGAGGAAMGYSQAGFTEIVGVDIEPQPNYPFTFIQGDALEPPVRLADFDLIHASPPCQAYSVLRRANPKAEYVDLIAPTRELLEASGRPWVIENVPGAPLEYSVVLCGSMFGLGADSGDGVVVKRTRRQLRRHRLFEANFFMLQPSCGHSGEAIGVYGGGPTGRYTFANGAKKDRYGRRGGYQGTIAEKRAAMEMQWMSSSEINQAIPPAYTKFIGEQFIDQLAYEETP